MPLSRLLTGPHLSRIERRAFAAVQPTIDDQPNSVLYLTRNPYSDDVTKGRWSEFGSPAALRVESIEDFVAAGYERELFKGRATHISRPLLLRLVELGIENLDSPTNPLNTHSRLPSSGLVQEAETLFTDLEFAGLLDAPSMQNALTQAGLSTRADAVEELAEGIEAVRSELLGCEIAETYVTERMHHVAKEGTDLPELFPSVDAVVLDHVLTVDRLERQLLERITEAWPTIALLPLQDEPEVEVGVDVAAEQALDTYLELGFEPEFIDEPMGELTANRRRLSRSLYRHPDDSPDTSNIDGQQLELQYLEPETIPAEIRTVARDIRARETDPEGSETIGVVLTSPQEYTTPLQEIFDQFELHYTLQTQTPLRETAHGHAIRSICQLAREPRSIDTLLNLLTNPLVTTDGHEGTSYHQSLSNIAARVETNGLETTLTHADAAVVAPIEAILDEIETLAETPLDDLPGALDSLLTRLGVDGALDGTRELPAHLLRQEQRARNRLDEVINTLALTHPLADYDLGDTLDRLDRALHAVSIRQSGHRSENDVVVCSLADAVAEDFDRMYVLGLTSTHFPSNPEPLAFTKPIYSRLPELNESDITAEARYHFALLLGSGASLTLSSPQRSINGETFVAADVLTELARLIELSELSEPLDAPHGCPEDVQAAIGELLAQSSVDRANRLVEEAVAARTFDPAQGPRTKAGLACGAAKAAPCLTPYDGQLSPEVVEQVHEAAVREPYSASRLETYAACGFKYYMRRVLDIEAPDPLTREPDAGTRGTYVHDVLEHFYRSLQGEHGEPVNPGGDFEAKETRLLTVALERLDEAFDEYDDTAFQADWLQKVLAGLGDPTENDYYGPDEETDDGRPLARGLLYRILEHEFDEPARTTARPSWFEARVGRPYDAGTSIQDTPAEIDTPNGPVEVYGLIDRIETVPGTSPTQLVVRDYKTGRSTPSEADVLLGTTFQLPLYALIAEDALENVETVGGAYYQTRPPSSVNSRSGLLTSQEMADYYGSDDVETPLLRYSYPHFETHAAFRRFIKETTTTRLGELTTGISEGHYQPTVLDPSDAGCRYCDYAHVCDVRHHQRRDVIEEIDGSGASVYVPPKGRGDDVEAILEAE